MCRNVDPTAVQPQHVRPSLRSLLRLRRDVEDAVELGGVDPARASALHDDLVTSRPHARGHAGDSSNHGVTTSPRFACAGDVREVSPAARAGLPGLTTRCPRREDAHAPVLPKDSHHVPPSARRQSTWHFSTPMRKFDAYVPCPLLIHLERRSDATTVPPTSHTMSAERRVRRPFRSASGPRRPSSRGPSRFRRGPKKKPSAARLRSACFPPSGRR